MKHIKCKNLQQWIEKAESWLDGQRSGGAKSLFLPAGNTCIPIFEALNKPNSILNEFELYQIDEVLTGGPKNLFADFFKTHLSEIKRGVRGLEHPAHCVDLAWLGLGLNGHVGFHEPGIQPGFNYGCVKLSAKTCETLELTANAWGITYGVGTFSQCQSVLMLVKGAQKTQVVNALLSEDKALPATYLASHNDFTLLTEGI